MSQDKLEAAASTYRRRIRNQPSVAAYAELARVLARLGHHDAARRARVNAKAMRHGKKVVQ
ncbi:hypothetical protein [Microbulbifer sp. 2205BS26-8]|uniref:hypothetical protein n=1 Tax=Microbulbifer sp. 2205BS26-8 TaxID=3064386 RepID=UPI00273F07A7|nr:hypothetical protein [Microbulbifer sp. 2205BS26-8]MDP5208516.1 hypothetical protein [Microbulbifer sp. 2205BS26-8]